MNKKLLTSLVLNVIVFVATTAVSVSYYFGSNNPLVENGLDSYKFFTTDSNILAATSSLVLVFFEIQILRGNRDRLPHAAIVFKFAAMISVMLTFFTVMVLLLPVYGAGFLLGGTAFYMHLAGPLIALFSFLFLETDSKISFSETFFALIPPAVYGAVYFTEVVLIGEKNGGWTDFYTFNRGGYWYVTMLVIFVLVFILALITRFVHNIFCEN